MAIAFGKTTSGRSSFISLRHRSSYRPKYTLREAVINPSVLNCGTSNRPFARGIACTAAFVDEPASGSPQSKLQPVPQASLKLTHQDAKAEIHVFGVEHSEAQPYIGEFILHARPHSVFVETSVCPEHGACPGALITCSDQVIGDAAGFVRMLCQAAAQVSEQGAGVSQTPYWEELCKFFPAEQLAYIAAFSTGARLVHCDRPKDITLRRLSSMASIHDLDHAFAAQTVSNFRDHLHLPPLPRDYDAMLLVQRILMLEREAIMCKVMDDACRAQWLGSAAGQPVSLQDFTPADTPPSSSGSSSAEGWTTMVAVVGDAHVAGDEIESSAKAARAVGAQAVEVDFEVQTQPGILCLKYLWESGSWRQLLGSQDLLTSPLLSVPPLVATGDAADLGDDNAAVVGLRRGMLDAFLRTCTTSEMTIEVSEVLGPVTPQQQPAFDAVTEVYGTTRMLMAVLPPDLLGQVCCGWRCEMDQILEPLRAVRPVNGGPGYSDEVIEQLRGLHFEL